MVAPQAQNTGSYIRDCTVPTYAAQHDHEKTLKNEEQSRYLPKSKVATFYVESAKILGAGCQGNDESGT